MFNKRKFLEVFIIIFSRSFLISPRTSALKSFKSFGNAASKSASNLSHDYRRVAEQLKSLKVWQGEAQEICDHFGFRKVSTI
jgi:hypothetical protein